MQNEVYIHGYNEPPPIPEKPAKVEEVKVYKIRHRKTGKYSSGTRWPHWSDNGKEWKTLGALGNHLAGIAHNGLYGHHYGGLHKQDKLEDIEVVAFDRTITTKESKADGAVGHVQGILDRRAKRKAKHEMSMAKYKIAKAEQDLAILYFAQEKLKQLKG